MDTKVFDQNVAGPLSTQHPAAGAVGGESCAGCKFSRMNLQAGQNLFFCRRYPPSTHLIMSPRGPAFAHEFTQVTKDLWCGEWKPRQTVQA